MDDLTREEMAQLFAVFRDQSLQILEEMGQDLIALDQSGFDEETAARLKRAAHTLKGDSACIGLGQVTEIAHAIEDVFEGRIGREKRIGKSALDLILTGMDAIKEALNAEGVSDVSAEAAGSIIERLKAVSAGEVESAASSDHKAPTAKAGGARRRDLIRIEAGKVDGLMNLAGEMLISRSVISQIVSEVETCLPKSDLAARLTSASNHMGKLISGLQKSVLKMRTVPLDGMLRRFLRPMRDLAERCNKQVEVEIRGGETELDRTLVELLYEPLLHLLRNAIDHGLETAEERIACGKREQGRVSIVAYHEGDQVIIEITDDGRGINPARLKAKAVEAGVLTPGEAESLSDGEAHDLIFVDGISTAREVTSVSGRGVGAAAVKGAIEQLRGSVSVASEQGLGTRFKLRLPLTLAIIRTLLFRSSGQLLALPLLGVSEVVRTGEEELIEIDGFESYRLRDRLISVVRPAVALSLDRWRGGSGAALRGRSEKPFIIVVVAGGVKYGVVADRLFGEQEMVVKPLESEWVQNEAVAGASILGDGRVALILDAEKLFRRAVRLEREMGGGKLSHAG
jgi:two-component system, chemotaxis family, sensor kinase CheA